MVGLLASTGESGVAAVLASVVSDVVDDLSSRQALAGAFSALAIAAAALAWWRWTIGILRARELIGTVVMVTGSRGKSSTVRALHAALSEAGLRTSAKTTGTAAAEIDPAGREQPTRRRGQANVLEVLRAMSRAVSHGEPPDALVVECMAVKPDLIALIAERMLRPDIVVITNVEVDHLEDEGSSLAEIASSMSASIIEGCFVVTGETRPEPLAAIRQVTAKRGAGLAVVRPDELRAETLARLPFVHPQNVALALAVTGHLGLTSEAAIRGMRTASREPGAFEVWRRDLHGHGGPRPAVYADIGAANDPASSLAALRALPAAMSHPEVRIGIVVNRWDRPLRGLSFVGALRLDDFDALVLVGGPARQMRRRLIDAGWPAGTLATAGVHWRRGTSWQRHITTLAERAGGRHGELAIVALQNEHDPLADRIRGFFAGGSLVSAPPRPAVDRGTDG